MEKGSLIGITGATGFVGSHLAPRLLEKGYEVKALIHTEEKGKNLGEKGVQTVLGDVTDKSSLEKAFKGTQAVIHLVSIRREKGTATFNAVNRQGVRNVVKALEKTGIHRLIYISIVKAAPGAKSKYLLSKWQAEEEIRKSKLKWTILRSALIYGPGGESTKTMANIVKLFPITPILGSGRYKMQPIFVEDVVGSLIKALEDDKTTCKLYEIGGPQALEYNEIMDTFGKVLGKKRRQIHLPIWPNLPFIFLGEIFLPNPLITLDELEVLLIDAIPAKNDIKEAFGINPVPFKEGLEKTLQ